MSTAFLRSLPLILICSLLVGFQYLGAYADPTGAVAVGNPDAPLNQGTASQTKNGALSVDALAVFGAMSAVGTATLDRVNAAQYCDQNGENCSTGDTGISLHQVTMQTDGDVLTANARCQQAGYDGYFAGMDLGGTETVTCFTSSLVAMEKCDVVTAQYGNNGTVYTKYYPASHNITHLVTTWSTDNGANFLPYSYDKQVRRHGASGDAQGFGLFVDRTEPLADSLSSGRPYIKVINGRQSVTMTGRDDQNGVPMYMTYQANVDCLTTDAGAPAGNDVLINGSHTAQQCVAAGGSVIEATNGSYVCQFKEVPVCGGWYCSTPNAECPSDWAQYDNWSTYPSKSCSNGSCGGGCTTTDLSWGENETVPSCTFRHRSGEECTPRWTNTCTAVRTEIGCY